MYYRVKYCRNKIITFEGANKNEENNFDDGVVYSGNV